MGIILLDNGQRVMFLNNWIKQHSYLNNNPEGMLITEVFPEIKTGRVYEAIKSAIHHNLASSLSQTLNKSPFQLFSSPLNREKKILMQQAVYIVPIKIDTFARYCLIQITDVSLSVSREKLLRNQAVLLREQSYLDALTGVANRRRFNEYAEDEFRRAKRNKTPFSIIMIDIDHFKLYNDYYGHLGGDTCLKQVANILCGIIKRPADLFARYGGEEFAAILPETCLDGAYNIAEIMVNKIQSMRMEHAKSPTAPYITISVGGATKTPEVDENLITVINSADQALYYVKQTGRNRALFYKHETAI